MNNFAIDTFFKKSLILFSGVLIDCKIVMQAHKQWKIDYCMKYYFKYLLKYQTFIDSFILNISFPSLSKYSFCQRNRKCLLILRASEGFSIE